jgi:hypothetical protein
LEPTSHQGIHPLLKIYLGCVTPIFVLIGLPFLVGGVAGAMQGVQLARNGTAAQGRVVSIEERGPLTAEGPKSLEPGAKRSPTDRVNYFTVVEFIAADGRTHRFVSNLGHGTPQHRIGQVVDVVYDPANPGRAQLRSALWSAGLALFPILVGLALLAVGIVPLVIVWSRKRSALRGGGE